MPIRTVDVFVEICCLEGVFTDHSHRAKDLHLYLGGQSYFLHQVLQLRVLQGFYMTVNVYEKTAILKLRDDCHLTGTVSTFGKIISIKFFRLIRDFFCRVEDCVVVSWNFYDLGDFDFFFNTLNLIFSHWPLVRKNMIWIRSLVDVNS